MRIRRKLSPEKQILVQKAVDKMLPEEDPLDITSPLTSANIGSWFAGTNTSMMDILQEIQVMLTNQDNKINRIYEQLIERDGL